MKFEIATWAIKDLLAIYEGGLIDLSPPYQRNAVWTVKSQQKLLESILTGKPIPNFFLLRKDTNRYEIVDGQQRVRSILAYFKDQLVDHENLTFQQRLANASSRQAVSHRFLEYPLSVTVVTELDEGEHIEAYYALLNSSGLRLNRPELKKAEFFTTVFLTLVMECATNEKLQSLRLFTSTSSLRMSDSDFVSELLALIRFGISDKKEKVDQLYEDDITPDDAAQLKTRFSEVVDIFGAFDNITPLIRTRYKQKNDFYSLFFLFLTTRNVEQLVLDHLYSILVRLGPHIRPSQEKCEPLREYAHHCVTQSNSKAARDSRHSILCNILLNRGATTNPVQEAICRYFSIPPAQMVRVGDFLTFNPRLIRDPNHYEFEYRGDEI